MSGEDDGVSGIASRFEQPAEDEPVQSKIADIASRFQGGSTPVGYAPKPTSTYTRPTTAAAAPKRGAPVKEGGVAASEEEPESKTVGSIAARFSSAARKEKEEEEGESAFSAAKGAFLKAEASKPTDTETKVMGVAAMFGDTTASKPARAPMPRGASGKKDPPVSAASRVSHDTGPGVASAAAMFQSGAAGGKRAGGAGAGGDGEEEEQPSERFANAAKMFGGN